MSENKEPSLSHEEIQTLYDRGILALLETQALFARISAEPELIFTSLFNPNVHQPYYALPFQVFRCSEELMEDDEKRTYSALAQYLKQIVVEYIHALDAEVSVEESMGGYSYPIVLNITYKEYEVCSFDFFKHQFGDRRKSFKFINNKGKNETIYVNHVDSIKVDIQQLNEYILDLRESNKELEDFVKNPLERSKKLKGKFKLFLKKEHLCSKCKKKIRENLDSIALMEEEIKEYKESLQKVSKIQKEIDRKYEFFSHLFIEHFKYTILK